jgi:recombination protein RecR
MDILPASVQKLISSLQKLPGLGPKSAARVALYMLKSQGSYTKELGQLLSSIQDDIRRCEVCNNITTDKRCVVCTDERRDHKIICVVEDPLDVVAFENGTEFSGVYHVLGGAISPVNGIGPEDLAIEQLINRISDGASEIIIATNPNIEGEATAMYIREEVSKLKNQSSIKVTRLARGLPTGADLEYADRTTIKRAFEGRTEY